MRRIAYTLALATVLAPLPLRADETDPNIPVANPKAKVQSVRQSCERRYEGQQLGSLEPATFCEVYAWSEIGQSYPALLDVARKLEKQYNKQAGKLEETRQQLRAERQHADELSKEIGKQSARVDRLKKRWPQWATWALSAGTLLVGGAAGVGLAKLLP
jgi:hypothetical protein